MGQWSRRRGTEAGHRGGAPRAVDHRPIAATVRSPGLRLRLALGHRGHVLGLQNVSDFKTRGFNLADSQLARTDRLDRLVLVLALALHWAVSTGLWDAVENRTPVEKRL